MEHRRAEIPPEEAKGKRRWRVIYLSDTALVIATRLAVLQPTGPLFCNTDGNPWKAQAVVCRFQRLLVKLFGVEAELLRLPRFDRRRYSNSVERAKAAHEAEVIARRKQRAKLARRRETWFAMYDLRRRSILYHGASIRIIRWRATTAAIGQNDSVREVEWRARCNAMTTMSDMEVRGESDMALGFCCCTQR